MKSMVLTEYKRLEIKDMPRPEVGPGDVRVKVDSCGICGSDVGLFVNDELAGSGIGAEIMGGPLKSLRWLVNHLVRGGDGLRAGQLVIPGSAVELRGVEQNDRVTARFTTVGRVEAVFQ